MKTTILYPKHPVLKDAIQYFLFIEKDGFDEVSQVCYPNTNHCLSIIQNGTIVKENDSAYRIMQSDFPSSYVTGIYKKPIRISVNFPYKELCINFKPLGMETVLNERLSTYSFKQNVLSHTNEVNWLQLFEIINCKNSVYEIQEELEDFFISHINEESFNQQDHVFDKIDSSTKIKDLNELINKSYRSTHRFFKNELGIPPKDFLMIKKTREGMKQLFSSKSITEIAYDLDFADQSHFIKTFKRHTSLTPLQFRRKSSLVDNTLIWKIE